METTMKLGDVLTAAEFAELRARISPEHHAEFDERVAELERDPALLGYIVESWADRAESLLRTPEEQARVVSARIRRIFGDDVDPRTIEVVCWQFLPPPSDTVN
jgi:hypothetical protein